mmetsp:Transcript_75677/g.198437  ORF Transcript_75677/g.198437 Transcript_75677/m.198437 type:complete len:360 (+) Transcript_75677:83-1162(+)
MVRDIGDIPPTTWNREESGRTPTSRSRADDPIDQVLLHAVLGQACGTLSMIDLATGEEFNSWTAHTDWILALDVDWAEMRALSGGGDGLLVLWDLTTGFNCELVLPEGVPRSPVRAIRCNWDDNKPQALTGFDSGRLILWDLAERKCEKVMSVRLDLIASIDVDWAKRRVLVGHGDAGLDLVDLDSGERVRSYAGHTCIVAAIAVNWQKARALCGSGDGALVLWDLRKGSQMHTLLGHKGSITAVLAKWETQRGLSCSADTKIRLWNLKAGECLAVASAHETPVRSMVSDWNSSLMLTCSSDGQLYVWEVEDSKVIGPEEIEAESREPSRAATAMSLKAQNRALCAEIEEGCFSRMISR